MGRVLPLFVLLLLASLGAGLGAPPKPSGLPKLGIVSAIGDKFYLRKIGITVFGNQSQEMAIDSWHLDDIMAAKLRTALAQRFDVQVVPVTYRRAAFANVADSSRIGDLVRTKVSPRGLDSYLVAYKRNQRYGNSNQILRGLGIVEGQSVFGPQTSVHAYYALSMVDGRTFTTGRSASGRIPDGTVLDALGVARRIEPSWWPTSLDAAGNQRLKNVLVELFDRSIPRTLEELQKNPLDAAIEYGR